MRCQVSRQTLRALNRTRQRGSGMQQAECAKRSLVSVTSLPPVYKNPTPPPPLKELKSGDQGFMSKLWSRYSIGGQQSRIHRAESLLQAAQVQSQDPYVIECPIIIARSTDQRSHHMTAAGMVLDVSLVTFAPDTPC